MPRARECVTTNRLPNGDFRHFRDGATNEVIATSRDHAHLRVETPELSRPLQRAAQIGYNASAAGGMIPGPSTGSRSSMPGRQGIRAWREQIPLAGAPTSLGLPPRSSLSGSFPWCRGESRVRCSPAIGFVLVYPSPVTSAPRLNCDVLFPG